MSLWLECFCRRDSPYKFFITKWSSPFIYRGKDCRTQIVLRKFGQKSFARPKKGLHVFCFWRKKSQIQIISAVSLIHHAMRTMLSKHLCPNFSRFCQDFQQIKIFGDALTPQHPRILQHWLRLQANLLH